MTTEVTTEGIIMTVEVGITGGTTLLKMEENRAITIPLLERF
jgi:fibrillarin-like rRNA methylase